MVKKITDYKKISKDLIPDSVLKKELINIIDSVNKQAEAIENTFERNIIDPFAFIIESIIFEKKDHKQWKLSEIARQVQKGFTNLLGEFHQNILCSLDGCLRPEGGVDFICEKEKIVAEIKNKHNTTNSKSKAGSFDELKHEISKSERENYIGYFVTIVPSTPKNYEKIFITTANKKKAEYREPNKRILSVNAEYFYEKITGKKDILKSIYQRIPEIFLILDKDKYKNINNIKKENYLNYYLLKAFKESK